MIEFETNDTKINQKEISAYVQQQMLDLTPHLNDKSAIEVRVLKSQDDFVVEVAISDDEGEIQTLGRHPDIFNAIRNAKDGLMEYFMEMENQANPHLRDEKINILSQQGNFYLH